MQVFAGHTGPVNCGEFTPDGLCSASITKYLCSDTWIREKNHHRRPRGIPNILGSSVFGSRLQIRP